MFGRKSLFQLINDNLYPLKDRGFIINEFIINDNNKIYSDVAADGCIAIIIKDNLFANSFFYYNDICDYLEPLLAILSRNRLLKSIAVYNSDCDLKEYFYNSDLDGLLFDLSNSGKILDIQICLNEF